MISEFTGEYRFLSNFYPVTIVYQGFSYRSVEHAYQAAKTLVLSERVIIQDCATAGQAKRAGRRLTLRSDWEAIKLLVMKNFIAEKFTSNEALREKLLATGEELLVEGNNWGDFYWGVCKGSGANHLGKILMDVRESIKYGKF